MLLHTHSRFTAPLAGLLALSAPLTLTACGPHDARPHSTPTAAPTASATAGFASDEEALAAAEKVYREYWTAINGGPDFDAIRELATSEYVSSEERTYRRLSSKGLSADGESQVVSFTLQQYAEPELSAYACVDISMTRIVDQNGRDVTPSDRADRSTLLVTFVLDGGQFFLSRSELWSSTCS